MTTLQRFRLSAALVLLLAAGVLSVGLYAPSLTDVMFARKTSGKTADFLGFNSRHDRLASTGVWDERKSVIGIRYPEQMRENETRIVELEYRVKSLQHSKKDSTPKMWYGDRDRLPTLSDVPAILEYNVLDLELSVHLGSSGFKLDPSGDLKRHLGERLPIIEKWTITPKGEGQRSLLLRVEEIGEEDQGTPDKYSEDAGELPRSGTINGKPILARADGWFELPVKVDTYWGVSRTTTSIGVGVTGLLGFVLGWPVLTGFVSSRRRVKCTVHTARLGSVACAFVNVVNRSQERSVEITHVWFATVPRVDVIRPERPLPKRLQPDESWETWIQVSELPGCAQNACFDKARVSLSSGRVIKSARREPTSSGIRAGSLGRTSVQQRRSGIAPGTGADGTDSAAAETGSEPSN